MRALLAACGLVICSGLARAQSSQQALAQPSESESESENESESESESEPSFGAVARIRPKPQAEHGLEPEENETLRRTLGASFNPVEALPGTVPVFSGVPYLLVRGAPPAGTAQYYDDVPVPALFHLALGPEITHPSLVGGLTFHPGIAPARYGRRTGAALVARGPSRATRSFASELELRLLDAHALVRAREPSIAVHGRFGYPNLLLDAIDSDAVLSYWDYLVRADHALDPRDELTLLVFGAGDRVGDRIEPEEDIALQFHRVLARLTRELPELSVGGQVYAGYEHGVLGSAMQAEMLRVGPSTWLELRPLQGTRIRVGLDMEAKLARVRHDQDDVDDELAPRAPGAGPGSPASFLPDGIEPDVSLTAGPEDIVDRAPLTGRPERNAAGVYAELALSPADPVEVELGLRGDGWIIAGRREQAIDPRALVRVRPLPWLGLHAGAGTGHQAAVSPIPIPGLSDLELDYGLQRAIQSEAGAEVQLPGRFTLSATGFYHRFSNLVFLELIVDCEGNSDPVAPLLFGPGLARLVPLCEEQGLPRGDGQAYGAELLLRRNLLERLSGWISYTLAWGEAAAGDGTEFVPQYDVRHVLNAVLTQEWGAGWSSGLRLHYRSGKPSVNTVFDFTRFTFDRLHTRLPAFFRADVTVAYEWPVSFGKLALSLQFLNVTFSREATKRDCSVSSTLSVVCEVDYQPAIVLPNLGLRAEL